jgi:probable methyltransferase
VKKNHARSYDMAPEFADFHGEVLNGLSARPKRIAPKFFYDRRGSALFEEICRLPEYYLARVETGILKAHSREIADLTGRGGVLIELGSGASHKVRYLLDALRPEAYLAVDISREFLLQSTRRLAHDYPWLEVHTACADLCRPLAFSSLPVGKPRLGFYPGSSIGNFEPEEARVFLQELLPLLGTDGALLIGVDLKKDATILNAAYNDAAGITAAFNLNLLDRMRRELCAQLDIAAYTHHAYFNEDAGRVEMRLVSCKPQHIRINSVFFSFETGESIHTENSYKYTVAEFQTLARAAGYAVERTWTDADEMFSVHYLSIADIS